MRLTARIKVSAGLVSFCSSRGEPMYLPVSASRSCLRCLAHGPLPLSAEPASKVGLSPSHLATSPTLPLLPPSSPLVITLGPCDYTGFLWVIQGHLLVMSSD